MKPIRLNTAALAFLALSAVPVAAADSTYTAIATADAFLAAGSPNNAAGSDLSSMNFGGTGTLAVAPASSVKGRFATVMKFSLDAAVSQFNTTLGAGKWHITHLTLSLASTYGTDGAQPGNVIFNAAKGGKFDVRWLPNSGWVEGTSGGMGGPGYPDNPAVSLKSEPALLMGAKPLGTFTYKPPGDSSYVTYDLTLDADAVAKAAAGGDFSVYFSAADDQVSYLFNARSFGMGSPELLVTAATTP